MKPIFFLLAASYFLFAGIPAHSEDSLRVPKLRGEYQKTRTADLATLNSSIATGVDGLMKQDLQSVNLQGANGIAAFPGQIETAPVLIAALNAALSSTNSHNLLSKENEKKWKISKGDWKIENNVLTGSGESYTVFRETFYPPFTLQFKINVLDGLRAHVGFGPLSFNDVGYDTDFGFWPRTGGKLFHFQRNIEYKISIFVSHKSVDLSIDDKPLDSAPGMKGKIDKLEFSAGDGWSKGRVEFRDIVVTK